MKRSYRSKNETVLQRIQETPEPISTTATILDEAEQGFRSLPYSMTSSRPAEDMVPSADLLASLSSRMRADALVQVSDTVPLLMGMVERRADGEIVHLHGNAAVGAYFNKPPEEIENKTLAELGIPVTLREQWNAEMEECATSNAPVSFEFEYQSLRHTPENPRHYWLKATIWSVLRDGEEDCHQFVYLIEDITSDRTAETALKESRRFLEKIAAATPTVWYVFDLQEQRSVYVNRGITKVLGYTPEEVYSGGVAMLAALVHPDDYETLVTRNARMLEEANAHPETEQVAEFRYRLRHKNGEWRWLQTFGTVFDRNEEGHVAHILNISLDITGQTDAEHKIEEQEYFIQQIADASPMVLYLFDIPSGKFHYLNREIFYVLGYTPEEVLDMTPEEVTDLYHPDDRTLLPERAGSGARFHYRESMMQYECRLRRKEGGWYWLLAREIVFRKDESGAVLQILGAALDINRRKEMERTLLQNAFQLEQSNASLEEFAYVASHDLKEPLRKISTFGDRLVSTQMDRMSDDGKIYLSKVVDASQRMQAMIDDLLSVSRISGDHAFESVSLQELLNDAQGALEYKIEQKSARIDFEAPLPW
ncbi:MAG: PAS domain S-box protein, partial [Oxalobacteraceae bacterium]